MKTAFGIALLLLTGCSAMNSLIFHPIHKVWQQHESNTEAARARESEAYVRALESSVTTNAYPK